MPIADEPIHRKENVRIPVFKDVMIEDTDTAAVRVLKGRLSEARHRIIELEIGVKSARREMDDKQRTLDEERTAYAEVKVALEILARNNDKCRDTTAPT